MHLFNIIFLIMLIISLGQTKAVGQARLEHFHLGDFKLESGEKILDCQIGYRIVGKMNDDKSNIILWPTWFGGTSKDILNLIGKDKLIDSTDYCIIIIDAFGNGVSSSPSNSKKQNGKKFPVFTVRDLVNAQYEFVTKKFGVNKVYCIIGGSMGAMQTLQWLVSYPDFMEKAIPYLGTPFRSSYDLLLNKLQAEIIEIGLKNKVPEIDIQYQLNLLLSLVAQTAGKFIQANPLKNFEGFLKKQYRKPSQNYTLYDYLSQLKCMYSHNITAKFDSSLEKTAKVVKAKTLVIVSSTDHIVHPYFMLEFARLINSEIYIIDSDCGHLAVNCDLENTRKKIMDFLVNK